MGQTVHIRIPCIEPVLAIERFHEDSEYTVHDRIGRTTTLIVLVRDWIVTHPKRAPAIVILHTELDLVLQARPFERLVPYRRDLCGVNAERASEHLAALDRRGNCRLFDHDSSVDQVVAADDCLHFTANALKSRVGTKVCRETNACRRSRSGKLLERSADRADHDHSDDSRNDQFDKREPAAPTRAPTGALTGQ
jgi:hypothetical protein